jgi:ADP-ribosyl-[dinitrogen reductase] hydrolase
LSDAATLGFGRLLVQLIQGTNRHATEQLIGQWISDNPTFRFTPYRGYASAYVVDTVQTVLHYFTLHADFENAMIATVNQGDDADTTGALLGMLAGARCGAARLPQRWLQRLQPATVLAVTQQTRELLRIATNFTSVATAVSRGTSTD